MHSYHIVPVVALLCYVFQLISLLPTKRKGPIDGFLGMLLCLIVWTGGSWLMRLGQGMSVDLWFHVSLTGLMLIPVMLFAFLRKFMEVKKTYHIHFWSAVIAVMLLINYVTGIFLKAPYVLETAAGRAYIYEFSWTVIFFFVAAAGALGECVRMAMENGGKNAFLRKQLKPIAAGLLFMVAGNSLVLLPAFKGIPLDICSGILMAGCMYYALYKKRLFKLNNLVSKANCYCAAFLISMSIFYQILPEFENYLKTSYAMTETEITIGVSFAVATITIFIYMLLKFLLDKVFEKEETVQSKSIVKFSKKMSYLQDIRAILSELMGIILNAIFAEDIYIFLKDSDSNFRLELSNVEKTGSYCIPRDSEFLRLLKDSGCQIVKKDYIETAYYRTNSADEKQMLLQRQIECAVGITDDQDFIGIIILSKKGNGRPYTHKDLEFLASINSVASIAIKNSQLYETAVAEASKDYLTGIANRKCLYETLQTCCERGDYAYGTLLIINVDDFKLYNQLYGDEAGDEALKRIAQIIQEVAEPPSLVARYSGKEFALLLPERTPEEVKTLAEKISCQVRELNHTTDDASEYAMKVLTVSCGIAKGDCPMEDYHELLNHANTAVYYAKQAGKNRIMIYKEGEETGTSKTSEMSYQSGIYSDYASTIYALTAAIDAKDHYTFSHSENVAYYSRELAKAYGMNEEALNVIYEAGLLHDIGKIGINEEILNKPGKLTPQEYQVMQTHVGLSIGIIRHLPSLDYVIPAVIGHHERYDGKGYPRAIGGTDIPLMARILCIADSFDAMISKRSYKPKMEVSKALEIIESEAGKQFDPKLAPIFIDLVKKGIIEIR